MTDDQGKVTTIEATSVADPAPKTGKTKPAAAKPPLGAISAGMRNRPPSGAKPVDPATLSKQILAIEKHLAVDDAAIASLTRWKAKVAPGQAAPDAATVELAVAEVRTFWKQARKRIDKLGDRIAPLAALPVRPRNPLLRTNPVLVEDSLRIRQLNTEIENLHALAQRERSWVKSVKRRLDNATDDELRDISERLETRTDFTEHEIVRRLVGMAAMAEAMDPRVVRPDFEKVARKLNKLRRAVKSSRNPSPGAGSASGGPAPAGPSTT
jgi:hypothetical protein